MNGKLALIFMLLAVSLLVTGCWSSLEIKDSAIVMGTGIEKGKEDHYRFSVEILTPSGDSAQGGGAPGAAGQSLVLEREAYSLFEAARNLIRDAKRRLVFTHNRVWIVSEKVAKENIVAPFDWVGRDQMLRLTSHLFVTAEDPKTILGTPALLEELSSLELATGIKTVKYISGYGSMEVKDFFKMLSGPVKAAYAPIIRIKQQADQSVTEIDGTAIIKGSKMVGRLDNIDTMGLLWLQNKVKGGAITTFLDKKGSKVAVELQRGKTEIKPKLKNGRLVAEIKIKLKGTLAAAPMDVEVNKDFLQKLEKKIEQDVTSQIESTLGKLQKKYKTDVSGIGLRIYRKYPKEWKHLEKNWEDVFAEGKIEIDVKADIYHQGLINQTRGGIFNKPQNNPFKR